MLAMVSDQVVTGRQQCLYVTHIDVCKDCNDAVHSHSLKEYATVQSRLMMQ
jgi:hypothetical protein